MSVLFTPSPRDTNAPAQHAQHTPTQHKYTHTLTHKKQLDALTNKTRRRLNLEKKLKKH